MLDDSEKRLQRLFEALHSKQFDDTERAGIAIQIMRLLAPSLKSRANVNRKLYRIGVHLRPYKRKSLTALNPFTVDSEERREYNDTLAALLDVLGITKQTILDHYARNQQRARRGRPARNKQAAELAELGLDELFDVDTI